MQVLFLGEKEQFLQPKIIMLKSVTMYLICPVFQSTGTLLEYTT